MYLKPGIHRAAASVLLAGLASAMLSLPAHAEPIKSINGVPMDSAVVDLYMQSRAKKPVAQLTADERDTLMRELTDVYLLSTQEVVKDIEKDPQFQAQVELQQRAALANAVATRFLANVPVTNAEIQTEYDEQIKMAPPLQFKARHILVPNEDAAKEIITRLNNGADFAELAKSDSTGPSASNGGDLSWFSPDQMVKPFSDAVAALEDGKYTTTPIQTQFGWHVILREESRPTEPPPLDSVRDKIHQKIQSAKFQEYLDSLRTKAAAN